MFFLCFRYSWFFFMTLHQIPTWEYLTWHYIAPHHHISTLEHDNISSSQNLHIRGLARYIVHFTATDLKKILLFFFVFWTPTLRLKITKIDPALRLLVLVFSFSPCYCGICPKKLVKWYFVGAVNSSTNEIYPLNLKGMDHKLMCSEIPGQLAFRWLNWRKNCFAPK